mmetsp:Transcript_62328/g.140972  ORF Transcript_62328/g.140972 Transcript_62328/m.140972 type:complete len:358 (+) Transcript_62328:1489-2562(+)
MSRCNSGRYPRQFGRARMPFCDTSSVRSPRSAPNSSGSSVSLLSFKRISWRAGALRSAGPSIFSMRLLFTKKRRSLGDAGTGGGSDRRLLAMLRCSRTAKSPSTLGATPGEVSRLKLRSRNLSEVLSPGLAAPSEAGRAVRAQWSAVKSWSRASLPVESGSAARSGECESLSFTRLPRSPRDSGSLASADRHRSSSVSVASLPRLSLSSATGLPFRPRETRCARSKKPSSSVATWLLRSSKYLSSLKARFDPMPLGSSAMELSPRSILTGRVISHAFSFAMRYLSGSVSSGGKTVRLRPASLATPEALQVAKSAAGSGDRGSSDGTASSVVLGRLSLASTSCFLSEMFLRISSFFLS